MPTGPCAAARPFRTTRRPQRTGRRRTPNLRPDAAPRPGSPTPRTSGAAGSSCLASRPGRRKSPARPPPRAGSPARGLRFSLDRRKSRPGPARAPEVPRPPALAGLAARGTRGSGGAVAVFCAGDCPPPPRGGARPKVSPEGPNRGLGVAGAHREPTSAAPSTHCGGLPRGSSTPTGSRPSARVGGTADGRPALRAPRGRRAAGRDSSSRGCGRGFLSARAPDGGRTINISAYLQRMTHPLSFLKYLFAIG